VPDVPGVPSAAELERLPHAELVALLAGAYQLIGQLRARVEHLERAAGKDSSTSSRPPSSDSPYKKPRDRSLRERGKRRPGKQPGEPGTTLNLIDDPGERLEFPPACCRGCGAALAGEPVLAGRRHQVTDIVPPPPPKVTEYVAQAKACPCCGTVSEGELPGHVRARASYGPEVHAQAANLACGHHVPVARAAQLPGQLGGVAVSSGWMAGIRGKAAALIEASGFAGRVRDLLAQAPTVHADETRPVPAAGCAVRAPGLHPLPGADAHRGPSAARSTPAASCPATAGSWSATATTAPGTWPSRQAPCPVRTGRRRCRS
jgi:transposase